LGSSVENSGSYSRLEWLTSSLMPMVKWFFGESLASSSKTPLTIAGVNSLDDRPVAAAESLRAWRKRQVRGILRQHGHNVLVERLAGSARLLAAVESTRST
jgi:hypothetical protein